MKVFRGIILLLCFPSALFSQSSLVPNGNFENFVVCPSDIVSGLDMDYFITINNWLRPTLGTSDYFHACATAFSPWFVPNNLFYTYQPAKSGFGYCGMHVYFGDIREYIQVELTSPLAASQCYYVEFWVAPSENLETIFIDKMGAYLSVDRVTSYSYSPIDVDPQIESIPGFYLSDTLRWTKVAGVYVATGGEHWLTIGNFRSDFETNIFLSDSISLGAYYAVDDVSLIPLDSVASIDFIQDTTVCAFDTVHLGALPGAGSYLWNTGDTTQVISVAETGTYIVELNFPCGIYYDTAHITITESAHIASHTDLPVCYFDIPVELSAGAMYDELLWNTGATSFSIDIDAPGVFYVDGIIGCNFYTDTFSVSVQAQLLEAELADTILTCTDPLQVLLSGPDGFEVYEWSTGEFTQQIEISDTGAYALTYANTCDTFSHSTQIITDPFLQYNLELPERLFICPVINPTTYIMVESVFDNYLWNTGESSSGIQIDVPGTYSVIIETLCRTLTDSTLVDVCETLSVPNAFSPNGDGVNDVFFVVCNPCNEFVSLSIYNRWGEIMFASKDPTIGWDGTIQGKLAPLASYVYVLQLEERVESGQLLLIR